MMKNNECVFTYGDMRRGLAKGICYRHPSWPAGHYVYSEGSNKRLDPKRFRNHFIEDFPIGLYDNEDKCDFVEYCMEGISKEDSIRNIDMIKDKLSTGIKLRRPHWKDSFIYREARIVDGDVLFDGITCIYWKQPGGNVVHEEYTFSVFEDGDFVLVTNEEVREIWGYLDGSH